jgi:hypothetical protein
MSFDLALSAVTLLFKMYKWTAKEKDLAASYVSLCERRIIRLFYMLPELREVFSHGSPAQRVACLHLKQDLQKVLNACLVNMRVKEGGFITRVFSNKDEVVPHLDRLSRCVDDLTLIVSMSTLIVVKQIDKRMVDAQNAIANRDAPVSSPSLPAAPVADEISLSMMSEDLDDWGVGFEEFVQHIVRDATALKSDQAAATVALGLRDVRQEALESQSESIFSSIDSLSTHGCPTEMDIDKWLREAPIVDIDGKPRHVRTVTLFVWQQWGRGTVISAETTILSSIQMVYIETNTETFHIRDPVTGHWLSVKNGQYDRDMAWTQGPNDDEILQFCLERQGESFFLRRLFQSSRSVYLQAVCFGYEEGSKLVSQVIPTLVRRGAHGEQLLDWEKLQPRSEWFPGNVLKFIVKEVAVNPPKGNKEPKETKVPARPKAPAVQGGVAGVQGPPITSLSSPSPQPQRSASPSPSRPAALPATPLTKSSVARQIFNFALEFGADIVDVGKKSWDVNEKLKAGESAW